MKKYAFLMLLLTISIGFVKADLPNSSWNTAKDITFWEVEGISRINEEITINVTDLALTNGCGDLRVYQGTTEVEYERFRHKLYQNTYDGRLSDNSFYNGQEGSDWCVISIPITISANSNVNYTIYHNLSEDYGDFSVNWTSQEFQRPFKNISWDFCRGESTYDQNLVNGGGSGTPENYWTGIPPTGRIAVWLATYKYDNQTGTNNVNNTFNYYVGMKENDDEDYRNYNFQDLVNGSLFNGCGFWGTSGTSGGGHTTLFPRQRGYGNVTLNGQYWYANNTGRVENYKRFDLGLYSDSQWDIFPTSSAYSTYKSYVSVVCYYGGMLSANNHYCVTQHRLSNNTVVTGSSIILHDVTNDSNFSDTNFFADRVVKMNMTLNFDTGEVWAWFYDNAYTTPNLLNSTYYVIDTFNSTNMWNQTYSPVAWSIGADYNRFAVEKLTVETTGRQPLSSLAQGSNYEYLPDVPPTITNHQVYYNGSHMIGIADIEDVNDDIDTITYTWYYNDVFNDTGQNITINASGNWTQEIFVNDSVGFNATSNETEFIDIFPPVILNHFITYNGTHLFDNSVVSDDVEVLSIEYDWFRNDTHVSTDQNLSLETYNATYTLQVTATDTAFQVTKANASYDIVLYAPQIISHTISDENTYFLMFQNITDPQETDVVFVDYWYWNDVVIANGTDTLNKSDIEDLDFGGTLVHQIIAQNYFNLSVEDNATIFVSPDYTNYAVFMTDFGTGTGAFLDAVTVPVTNMVVAVLVTLFVIVTLYGVKDDILKIFNQTKR